MDPQLSARLADLEKKIDAIYATTERVRTYFLWTLIVTLALVVVPAIGLVFAIPSFVAQYGQIDQLSQF